MSQEMMQEPGAVNNCRVVPRLQQQLQEALAASPALPRQGMHSCLTKPCPPVTPKLSTAGTFPPLLLKASGACSITLSL